MYTKKNMYTIKNKIIYKYTWCMVFVMILNRINSSETSASCAAGVICFFIYYLVVKVYNYVKLEIKLKI